MKLRSDQENLLIVADYTTVVPHVTVLDTE